MSHAVAQSLDPSQEVGPNAPACRVLHLRMSNFGKIESAECPGMADEAAQKLAAAGALWRDERFRIKRMSDVCRELNLPPFAVLQTFGHKQRLRFEAPPPLNVPFEPVELDESQPALTGMVETLVLSDSHPDKINVRPASWYARSFVRLGGLSILLMVSGIQAVVQTIAQTATHGYKFWLIAVIWGTFGVIVGSCAYVLWRTSAQWFLIPGGVVVRRALWKDFGVRLERYTPADTLLMMLPNNIAWFASLIRNNRPAHRKLFTRMEATALLAAWQSSIPPRELDEMPDLR